MTAGAAAWPNPLEDEYELRVTARAREDLRVSGFPARDLADMAHASPWGSLIDKFTSQRALWTLPAPRNP
ncbi:hypothetical protein GCM10023328_47700 [Modestobacter marinus]|uniref:Uncharacterized protein n=1 Tax=Modestobacter marinus TaxID=477641 RepID=A0A846LRY3_9ACTN|nr:hypothetical protein [Modestobacter marinus]NIH70286.1 hypothetical protein [Modestobacter marinus]NIH70339.1 hypothetical protein [Modestobacter marinus]GGL83578.1 hypothetical protein GCM10011589_44990 [Modestobacter marinus]